MQPKEISGYRVVRRLGAGGMGEVFLVEHPRLPRQDALKLLGPQLGGDPSFAARFLREADILAGLRHPNIVTIHDRGEYEGQLWLAMEYVEGEDAAQYLRTRGPLPPAMVADVIDQVGSALDWAWHERRLTHRDVKPGNILLAPVRPGRPVAVKLVDFGIAKATDEASSLTETGVAVGTMAYLAPEVIEGNPLDNRADEYSLACAAFELLTGAPPYGPGAPSSVLMAHLQAPVPDPATRVAGIPPGLAPVFERALAKQPRDRFPDNASFAAAFRAALTGPASSSGPGAPIRPGAGSGGPPAGPGGPPAGAGAGSGPTVIRPTPPPAPVGHTTPAQPPVGMPRTPAPGPAPTAVAGIGATGAGVPARNGRVRALAALVAVLVIALLSVGYLALVRGGDSTVADPTTVAPPTATAPTAPTSPDDTSTVPTGASETSAPTVPGTDAYGFVGSPARCAGGETLRFALLTSKANGGGSRVVICGSAGDLTYRGAQITGDNSGITLSATRRDDGTFRAVDRDAKGKDKDDTIYTVSSGGLVITRGDGRAVSSEPARSVWSR
ncbi:serine/threonine-protein kinase [Tsukamurella paurometabola]|uniref:non-specific serine/threonine protein kinase n=1 Tax=Tsukamurella paurometabola TaxID=2061 RepID=A0ABS5NFY5_TSUPA|nr:serine/threonine-protein kinase [Tsukamurella paurometabola]MBS4103176.1 protein kinase [Tsukamurella paurometabola]